MAEVFIKEPVADMNEIRFTGVMTGKRENPAAMTVFFRMTTKHGARRYGNAPSLNVFDDELKKKINAIPLRTKVAIKGYVTSSKPKTDENGNTLPRKLQSFVMTDIEPVTDEIPDNNEVEIIGAVERAYVARGGNVNFIVVSFREGHYMKRIKVEGFPRDGVNYLEYMAAGTRVHIKGHCSTRSENTDNGMQYYEYIILDSIEKV